MKPSETLTLVRSLVAAFPRQDVSPETMKIYCEMLADLDHSRAQEAINRIIASGKFFPTIAEIRAAAVEGQTLMPDIEQAWGEVKRAISSQGRYRNPEWSHSAITSAVDAIGWQTLCDSENIGIERAHFIKLYQAHAETEKRTAQLGKFALPSHEDRKQLIEAKVTSLVEHLARKDEKDGAA